MQLKYGHSSLVLTLPDSLPVELIRAGRALPAADEISVIENALAAPIGSRPLAEIVRPGQKVAIVTSDITRPCPSDRLLPPLLDELNRGGVGDADIRLVFGLGTHRSQSQAEQKSLVGENVFRRVQCVDSDPADCVLVGETRRGTPVWVFRPVVEADVRVCVGNIEFHWFAGYSGGVKAIIPGVANAHTIRQNHRWMTQPGAVTAALDGNPVREDIEEAGEMVGVHFILNAILNESKTIVGAVAGHPRQAHRAGCQKLDECGLVTIDHPADIVIVSAGGHPKDLNLYQAQKALDNARPIVAPGGIIILVAECLEGMGHRVFEQWMHMPGGPEAIIAEIQREFVLGGHKAAAVAMTMRQARIALVSAMPADDVRAMGFLPFANLGEAVEFAFTQFSTPRIAVMPEGGSVVPRVAPALRA